VLDHLRQGSPLYVDTEKMLHALAVAEAAEQSAQTQQVVCVQD
jgi:biliverdin reductase